MKLEERPGGFALYKEKTEVGCCQLTRTAAGADVALPLYQNGGGKAMGLIC